MTAYAEENVEQGEYFSMAGGSANLHNYFGNKFGGFLKKKKKQWELIYFKIHLYHSGT